MERRAFRNHLVCADKELGVPIISRCFTPSCNLDSPATIITCSISDGGDKRIIMIWVTEKEATRVGTFQRTVRDSTCHNCGRSIDIRISKIMTNGRGTGVTVIGTILSIINNVCRVALQLDNSHVTRIFLGISTIPIRKICPLGIIIAIQYMVTSSSFNIITTIKLPKCKHDSIFTIDNTSVSILIIKSTKA